MEVKTTGHYCRLPGWVPVYCEVAIAGSDL